MEPDYSDIESALAWSMEHQPATALCLAVAMWRATGQQKIVWFDCGHYTAALYIVPALSNIAQHFGAD